MSKKSKFNPFCCKNRWIALEDRRRPTDFFFYFKWKKQRNGSTSYFFVYFQQSCIVASHYTLRMKFLKCSEKNNKVSRAMNCFGGSLWFWKMKFDFGHRVFQSSHGFCKVKVMVRVDVLFYLRQFLSTTRSTTLKRGQKINWFTCHLFLLIWLYL